MPKRSACDADANLDLGDWHAATFATDAGGAELLTFHWRVGWSFYTAAIPLDGTA
jgi:hypothetical protein